MTLPEDFDVVVVGGGVASSTAARLFARRGASVALVERRTDPSAYKVTCTHAILPPATPTIERLGLDFSTAREVTRLERHAFHRAAVDPVFARAFSKVLTRERSVFHLLNPRVAGRLLIPGAGLSEAA